MTIIILLSVIIVSQIYLIYKVRRMDELFDDCRKRRDVNNKSTDLLYEEAKKIVIEKEKASASLLQKDLLIGYAGAAHLLDLLEEKGVVGSSRGAEPREILIKNSSKDKE